MKTKTPNVIDTAKELAVAQTALKTCRTQEETKEKAYVSAHEATVKAEARKEKALKEHNAALRELR